MAKFIVTREFGAVYLTDNLLSPPQMSHPEKKFYRKGDIIEARKPTPQEMASYKVFEADNLISSDGWIIYTNAVQPYAPRPVDQLEPVNANAESKPNAVVIGLAVILILLIVLD